MKLSVSSFYLAAQLTYLGFFTAHRDTLYLFAGSPPADPRIGFLPPNNGTTGQGYVTFSIMPSKTAPSLTRIDATATIYFDQNEPIETPPIFNTVSTIFKYPDY